MVYITQNIAENIKKTLKNRKISMKVMLADVGLGINAISELSKGKQLSCISLAKIADYLDVSVDYLLGRTDVPEINGAETKRLLENYTPDLTSDYIAAYDGNAPQASALSAEQKEKVKKLLIEIQNEIL